MVKLAALAFSLGLLFSLPTFGCCQEDETEEVIRAVLMYLARDYGKIDLVPETHALGLQEISRKRKNQLIIRIANERLRIPISLAEDYENRNHEKISLANLNLEIGIPVSPGPSARAVMSLPGFEGNLALLSLVLSHDTPDDRAGFLILLENQGGTWTVTKELCIARS